MTTVSNWITTAGLVLLLVGVVMILGPGVGVIVAGFALIGIGGSLHQAAEKERRHPSNTRSGGS